MIGDEAYGITNYAEGRELIERWDSRQMKSVMEGVATTIAADDDVTPHILHQQLLTRYEFALLTMPASHSNDVVKNIVHQAMYPYIERTSLVESNKDSAVPPCSFSSSDIWRQAEDY